MRENASTSPLVQARDLKIHFPIHRGVFRRVSAWVRAVDGVNLRIGSGEVISIVGESGCGKSTLGLSLLGLVPITSGELKLNGERIETRLPSSWNAHRKDFQIVFQDPYTSLNPRHTIYEILSAPMLAHSICSPRDAREKVAGWLRRVGLEPDYMDRFPHAFSGGQRQRIGIARAVSLRPKMIVCDEVVAALDVSVQAQILQLLMELKQELGLSLLFISHDLALVKAISDQVHVMYLGRVVESSVPTGLFHHPRHPYSQALLNAIPTLDRGRRPGILKGEVPSSIHPPSGCTFRTRCPKAEAKCAASYPVATREGKSEVHCHFPLSETSQSTQH